MYRLCIVNTVSRLFSVFSLVMLMSLTSGCATRALMSSDRFDQTELNEQQVHASEIETKKLQQAYQLAQQQPESLL